MSQLQFVELLEVIFVFEEERTRQSVNYECFAWQRGYFYVQVL